MFVADEDAVDTEVESDVVAKAGEEKMCVGELADCAGTGMLPKSLLRSGPAGGGGTDDAAVPSDLIKSVMLVVLLLWLTTIWSKPEFGWG